MDDTYDVIVCGTGMTECVLSGLLSMEGKKVLHVDRNRYYGGDCASLNLEQLFESFGAGRPPPELGKSHLFNVDLAPKLLMGEGLLVKILRRTVADRYSMEFMVIEGSYVLHDKKIHKVPASPAEALKSGLMSLFEKRRCAKFLDFVQEYDPAKPATFKKLDPSRMTFQQLCDEFGLDKNTVGFIGTAIALELTEDFLTRPATQTIPALKLYAESAARFDKSPYVYPLYGLSDIPQAFARLCAVHGGTYMLDRPVDGIVVEEGRVVGIRSGDKVARAPIVVGDPTYFLGATPPIVRQVGSTVRAVCLLNHPVPGIADGAKSCQIILPARETKRRNDIYIVCVCDTHKVVPPGLFLAIVSAVNEGGSLDEVVGPGVRLLGPVLHKFVREYPMYKPTTEGVPAGVFASESLDATSHFESACDDILSLYKRIMGKDLDLTAPPPDPTGAHHGGAAPPAS